MSTNQDNLSRRDFFRKSSALTAAAFAAGSFVTSEDVEAATNNVNTNSQPSNLRITDIKTGTIYRQVLRIETNQGIFGYGEGTGPDGNLVLQLRGDLVGQNPCSVEMLYNKIKRYGDHNRTGVSGIEMALWDIAGKAWGVPVYQMLGGKYRDKILMYADTPYQIDPKVMGERLKGRMAMGFKFLKMDMGVTQIAEVPDTISAPPGVSKHNWSGDTPHPLTGMRVTQKGLDIMAEYAKTVRDIVGWEIPLAADHFGHFMVEDAIKIGLALDPFNFAWYEDMVPFTYPDALKKISDTVLTPLLIGETMFSAEAHRELFEKRAVAMCHPDIIFCGGCLEMKKICDFAEQYGIAAAIHMNNGPVAMFASIHAVAAANNFMCMECHHADNASYDTLVDVPGLSKPFIQDGYVTVPDGPGFGFELNEEAIRQFLRMGPGQQIFRDPANTGEGFRRGGGTRNRGITNRLWSRETNAKTVKNPTMRS
ncbi:MAG: mandelate racemase/muconate lactonizing enzyme family protein [Sedimentisphaerales bacterium]|nr:mandelate racemase/muconate lactonizing enzyme family protein [Sedimentisphaerales bacterium]